MDVSISGDSIRLGQFLKLANLVESGGHAKEAIAAGDVAENGLVSEDDSTIHRITLKTLADDGCLSARKDLVPLDD